MVPQIPKLPYLGFYLSVFPISSPFIICTILASIFMCSNGPFWLHLGPSALFLVSRVCPKYTICHISASIYPFDPISSPFLICRIGSSILMLCQWIQDGLTEFWFFCTVFVCQSYPKRGIDAARSCGHHFREC